MKAMQSGKCRDYHQTRAIYAGFDLGKINVIEDISGRQGPEQGRWQSANHARLSDLNPVILTRTPARKARANHTRKTGGVCGAIGADTTQLNDRLPCGLKLWLFAAALNSRPSRF